MNGTVNDLAVAGARPLALSVCAGPRGGARRPTTCGPRSRRWRPPPSGRGRDRHRRHQGGRARALRLDVRHAPPGSAGSTRARRSAPAALEPGDRVLVSGHDRRARHRDHAGPRRARARRRDRLRHRARCGRRPTRCSRRPGAGFAACATRPAAASPPSSTSSPAPPRSAIRSREADVPVRPEVAGAAELLGHRPDVRGQRGRAGRLRRARARRTRRWRRCARRPAASGAAEIGEVRDRAAGDGPGGDGLRRPSGDGPARRRSAAEDLLSDESCWNTELQRLLRPEPRRDDDGRAKHRVRSGPGEDRGDRPRT